MSTTAYITTTKTTNKISYIRNRWEKSLEKDKNKIERTHKTNNVCVDYFGVCRFLWFLIIEHEKMYN